MSYARYTGGGFGGSLDGVPARDLSKEEYDAAVERHGKEAVGRLYELVKQAVAAKKESKESEVKDARR